MRHMRPAGLLLVALVALVLAAAPSAATTTTSTQLTTRFKASTGEKLLVNKSTSYAGHYRAYDLGVQTPAKRARWGTFAVYLVTAADVEAEVTNLLSDTRSGVLGTPTAAGVYWEQGATLQGQVYGRRSGATDRTSSLHEFHGKYSSSPSAVKRVVTG